MRKLLIVGDSLSMSRYREGVTYDSMYSTLFTRHLKEWLVINGSVRANTSRKIVSPGYQEEYILPLLPDVVILQIGVVDCLPRLMTKYERFALGILMRIHGFRRLAKLYISFKSRRRSYFTKRNRIFFVEEREFKENIIKFRDRLGQMGSRVIAINIPCPGRNLSERTFGVNEVVSRYNDVIDQVFSETGGFVVDLYGMTKSNPSLLQQDGYHIRAECHGLLYEEIRKSGFFGHMMER